MSSCWELPRAESAPVWRHYGHLASLNLREWASDDADLSELFEKGETCNVSATRKGLARKNNMLERIDVAFSQRANAEICGLYREKYQEQFRKKLEDPGLLHNFEYFNIPSSDYMLMFYISMWNGKMADAMIYLHDYGWDLKGEFHKIPIHDVWCQMSYYEAMNINERIKAQSVVDKIDAIIAKKSFAGEFGSHVTANVMAFAGGNLPERFYGTSDGRNGGKWIGRPFDEPEQVNIIVFDNGDVRPMEELYPEDQRGAVDYIHESFENAPKHQELLGTQDLIWMHGLSMYLGPRVPDALLAGALLLVDTGEMMYDYLIMTESLRRCLNTQGWPTNKDEMFIQPDVQSAYEQAQKDVRALNFKVESGKFRFEIEGAEITEIEPWGATSLRITLRKYTIAL